MANDNAHMSRHLIRNVTELLLDQLELKTTNPKRKLNSKNLKEKCKWIKKEIIDHWPHKALKNPKFSI